MNKLKSAICLKCGKKIDRHDEKRISLQVGENAGQKSYRSLHLSCSQISSADMTPTDPLK